MEVVSVTVEWASDNSLKNEDYYRAVLIFSPIYPAFDKKNDSHSACYQKLWGPKNCITTIAFVVKFAGTFRMISNNTEFLEILGSRRKSSKVP